MFINNSIASPEDAVIVIKYTFFCQTICYCFTCMFSRNDFCFNLRAYQRNNLSKIWPL